jgi:hypothetical protein
MDQPQRLVKEETDTTTLICETVYKIVQETEIQSDKLQHFFGSTVPFVMSMYECPEALSVASLGIMYFFDAYRAGIYKELNDRQESEESKQELADHLVKIEDSIKKLDSFCKRYNLDEGDLLADIGGCGFALMKYSIRELEFSYKK